MTTMATLETAQDRIALARTKLDSGALLDSGDVGALLGHHIDTVRRKVRQGVLPAPDVGSGRGSRWYSSTIRKLVEGPSRRRA